MGSEATRWTIGLGLLLLAAPMACGTTLSEEKCNEVRGAAYEIINEAHTCNSDADCVETEWPGCTKPASRKNKKRITAFKTKFDDGNCKEPQTECREIPEIYCKQGLCVFREKAGMKNPTK